MPKNAYLKKSYENRLSVRVSAPTSVGLWRLGTFSPHPTRCYPTYCYKFVECVLLLLKKGI